MNDVQVTHEPETRARARRPRVWLRAALVLIFVALVGGGLVAFHQFKSGIIRQVVAGIQAQLPTVATATVTTEPWQAEIRASGTLHAAQGADLAAEAAGIVDTVHIDSGADVARGTVLLTLRSAEDVAKLAQLQAAVDLAATTYARDQKQLRAQAVSQATVTPTWPPCAAPRRRWPPSRR